MSQCTGYKTVVRKNKYGWIALRMCFDQEVIRALGRSRIEAANNLANEMVREGIVFTKRKIKR